MAGPWLALLVKSIPWVELARRTPEIIDSSRRLLERSRSAAESRGAGRLGPDELAERVRLLEQRDVEHAKVVEQVAAQVKDLTDAVAVLEVRTRRLAYLLAALVIVGALGAAALILAVGPTA